MEPSELANLEESDQPVLVCDADGRVAACSASAARVLGRPVAEILGQPIWTLMGADHAASSAEVSAATDGGSPTLFTLDDTTARVVFLNQRTVHEPVAAGHLLDDPRCGTLFDASRDGIAFVALDGRILDANAAFLNMLGYTLDEIRQLRYQDFTPPRWAEAEAAIVRDQILVHGRAEDYEKEYIRRDGTIITVQVRAWLVRDADGRPYCMAGVARDVTAARQAEEERRQLESELVHARRMEAIGQLAGGVAHDFNNVLTAILGSAELLRAQFDPRQPADAAKLAYLDQIQSAAERASTLTRQMLSFSRRQSRQREVLDLSTLVRELEPLLRRMIPESIEIDLQLAPHGVRIEADPSQIEQAVLNLCANARDAMPDGGRLMIRTSQVMLDEAYALVQPGARPGPHVLLTIRDTGCGMSREVQAHIFEPFFTTKPVGRGTGLGLSTVYATINDLDGHVRVASEIGQGSSFELYIPAAGVTGAQRQAVAVPPSDDAALTGSETILVCEDDDTVRDVCCRFLRGAGYQVMAASSAEEALRLAAKNVSRVDLLVTDLIMPGMNGQKLAEALVAAQPWLKTIFISGYAGASGVSTPVDDVLEKPFSRRLLLRRVRSALDEEKARQ